jgi:hypothetical protein
MLTVNELSYTLDPLRKNFKTDWFLIQRITIFVLNIQCCPKQTTIKDKITQRYIVLIYYRTKFAI